MWSAFQDLATSRPAFAAQEIREQLASVAVTLAQNQQLSTEQRQQFALFTLGEIQKQINAYSLDTREVLEMAYVLRAYGAFAEARKYMNIAEQQSPAKIDLLLLEGMTAWEQGDVKAARTFFDRAYALAPQFSDLALYAAAGAILNADSAQADALLSKVGAPAAAESPILSSAYISLASGYYASGKVSEAVRILHEAARRFPSLQSDIDGALKKISNGQ
jgi:tetratricopeptide (TPR) repeat protein